MVFQEKRKPVKIEEEIKTSIEKDIDRNDLENTQNKPSSDLMDALRTLHNPQNIESNTILTNRQVLKLSLMNWASQVYGYRCFKYFIQLFPRYRISGDDGRGRKEVIEIANAIRTEHEQQHERLMEQIRGR
jgi:hypothetical protein